MVGYFQGEQNIYKVMFTNLNINTECVRCRHILAGLEPATIGLERVLEICKFDIEVVSTSS